MCEEEFLGFASSCFEVAWSVNKRCDGEVRCSEGLRIAFKGSIMYSTTLRRLCVNMVTGRVPEGGE